MIKYVASWSGGKDSTASIILAHEHNEPLDLIIFAEVMFDKNISGELPEHIDFIKNKAIPTFESWGYKVKILHSDKTYMDCFHHIIVRGKNVGKKKGFVMSGHCDVQGYCKLRAIKQFWKSFKHEYVQYIGIAIDEKKRLERLDDGKISLLEKYKLTEQDAFTLCKKYGLLSPIYEFAPRGGCWFCPNMKVKELKRLRKKHNNLWKKLLCLENESNLAGYEYDMLNHKSVHWYESYFSGLEKSKQMLYEYLKTK